MRGNRFERGVDADFVVPGAEIATDLILRLCGGEASQLIVVGDRQRAAPNLTLRPDRVASLGGVAIEADEQIRILTALGFACRWDGDRLVVQPPSWRRDVEGEADLVEEVLRVHGYDRIPTVPLPRHHVVTRPACSNGWRAATRARRFLATRGLDEAVTFSFLSRHRAEQFGGGEAGLCLANPISTALEYMRAFAITQPDRGSGAGSCQRVGPG